MDGTDSDSVGVLAYYLRKKRRCKQRRFGSTVHSLLPFCVPVYKLVLTFNSIRFPSIATIKW